MVLEEGTAHAQGWQKEGVLHIQPLTGSKWRLKNQGLPQASGWGPWLLVPGWLSPSCWGPCLTGPHDFISVQGFGAGGTGRES